MERCQQLVLMLCLTAVVPGMNKLGHITEAAVDALVTAQLLKVIPHCDNSSSITKLVIKENMITLNETDRLALATYQTLVELHLDGNLVTAIPAKYFSVVPHLSVLSLSRNNISSLDPEAFIGLNVLTKLDLSHNLLTSLPPTLFRGLNNLKVLKLQDNSWNCSCPLLIAIREVKAAIVNFVGPRATCASPENQTGNDLLTATFECYPLPSTAFTTDPQKPPTPVNPQRSCGSPTALKVRALSSQNHSMNKDQTRVLGNTWKFTVCVAALALTISMLIIFAIKGPSWYKLYHNYRHRRLDQGWDDEEDVVSTIFSETGRYRHHQTFTFEQGNGQTDEEDEEEEEEKTEDEYFEDPYIKREDLHAGEGHLPEP